jgi:uncharacterized protein YndB with AHSA1/START domain
MVSLQFSTHITASPFEVWFMLWNEYSYKQWTKAFHPGSYAKSDWQQGSRIHFLTPEGQGMYANIDVLVPQQKMVFHHLGEIMGFEEQPANESWKDAYETYELYPDETGTLLKVSVATEEAYKGAFGNMFPKALATLKAMAEHFMITVEAVVAAPLEKVWDCWTLPQHIVQWNQASEDWHTPTATNDLKVGGKFTSRMEAKDGSMGFDFEGIYDVVDWHKSIGYHMADGRKVSIRFDTQPNGTLVTESFDPENMHSYDLQHAGWQAILNSFKSYTEGI